MRPAVGVAALLLGMVLSAAAGAEDYPYSGYFVASLPDEAPADAQLACASGFFRQGPDGSFVNYHIDPTAYDRDRTIRYLQYGRGQCTLLDGGRIESCLMAFSTDASEIGVAYINDLRSIGADTIVVGFYDDVPSARAALAGTGPKAEDSLFVRCAGFSDETVGPALTTEVSRLSLDDRNALLSPDLDTATRARLTAILDRLLHKP